MRNLNSRFPQNTLIVLGTPKWPKDDHRECVRRECAELKQQIPAEHADCPRDTKVAIGRSPGVCEEGMCGT